MSSMVAMSLVNLFIILPERGQAKNKVGKNSSNVVNDYLNMAFNMVLQKKKKK